MVAPLCSDALGRKESVIISQSNMPSNLSDTASQRVWFRCLELASSNPQITSVAQSLSFAGGEVKTDDEAFGDGK
jgi:hypothetical protein